MDSNPVVSLWDQFSNLGGWERHAIDTTSHSTADTVAAVIAAMTSASYTLSTSF